MKLLTRRLRGGERRAYLAFARHCRPLLAYRRLAEEIRADATDAVSRLTRANDERVGPRPGDVSDVQSAELMLTTVREEIALLQEMKIRHLSIGEVAARHVIVPYSRVDAWMDRMFDRATLEARYFADWPPSAAQHDPERIEALVRAEGAAEHKALDAINAFERRVEVTPEELATMNLEVVNDIRMSRELTELPRDEFEARWSQQLAGTQVRFFDGAERLSPDR